MKLSALDAIKDPTLPEDPKEQYQFILKELRLCNYSGGSGRGASFWNDAAKCGMRAMLSEQQREIYSNDPSKIPPLAPEALHRKQYFAVGSAYHKLQELWRLGEIPDIPLQFPEPLEDASIVEAVRLFEGYAYHWSREFWGKTIGIEEQIPSTPEAATRIHEAFGVGLTAKLDLVVRIEREDLDRVRERCEGVVEPGCYVVDFKTSDQPYGSLYYRSGMQALWYPQAWNFQHPSSPIVGTIFDEIYKYGRRKDQSITRANFGAICVPTPDIRECGAMIGMIDQGLANLERAKKKGQGNRAECFQYSFGGINTCQFYGKTCNNDSIALFKARGKR